jgi:4-hydroxybenzoate polyprenyltransferase
VKIFYVALVWALVNSWLFLPTINWGIFFISWLFISAMILPFDIRDIHEKEIVTFPRLIGVQNTKYLAYLMLSASALIAIETLQPVYALAYFLTMVIAFVMVYFSEPKRNELYFSFWVDLIPFFPLFFLILLKYF